MYGLVNKAIKDLVIKGHGQETWNRICQKVGFNEGDFVGMNPYPDKLTYDFVGAVSEELGADPADILEAFGQHWILYTANEGYGDLLDLTGDSFVEFLDNLDMLHYRINNLMPKLQAPQFVTRNHKENSVELEYHSHREGLSPMLVGLIKGLGKRFDLEIKEVKQIEFKSKNDENNVFFIEW